MSSQHRLIDDFFAVRLKQFLFPDLKRLRQEIRPDGNVRGCTTATAMLAFSAMDLLGFLMRDDPSAKKEQSAKNIRFFIDSLFPYDQARHATVLVRLFRHGAMHQTLPKACGISKPDPPNDHLIFYKDEETPHLNVDVLVDSLFVAIEALAGRKDEDPELARRMNCRLGELQEDDRKERQALRDQGDLVYQDGWRVSATTTSTT